MKRNEQERKRLKTVRCQRSDFSVVDTAKHKMELEVSD